MTRIQPPAHHDHISDGDRDNHGFCCRRRGAGGASVAADFSNGLPGSAPGGGGSGSSNRRYARGQDPRWGYAGGGGGGYCAITYSAGDYAPGSVITVTVGSGGSGGNGTRDGGAGARGKVTITWN